MQPQLSAGLDILRVLPPTNNGAGFTAPAKRSTEQYRTNIYELRYRAGEIMRGRQMACGCRMINKEEGVCVSRDDDGRDFYTGVQTCGSVWTCPVCSLKISRQRCVEVQDILHKMQHDGNATGFLTLTWRHRPEETLKEVLNRGMKTYRAMMKHRAAKILRTGCNIVGDIRALEIKFGNNGWHPHLHIAIVANERAHVLEAYAKNLIELWVSMHEGEASPEAQKYKEIYSAEGISEYITKWDASAEMTRANAKVRSKANSVTPFGLLELAGDKTISVQQRKYYCAKFREYGQAMKGRKQLTKGRKLLDLYKDILFNMRERGVEQEKTDEEIANERHKGELQFHMEPELYEFVVEQRLQAHILNAYASGGIAEIVDMALEFGVVLDVDWNRRYLWIADSG